MKIRFLGTSHGVPMPGRNCQSMLIETEYGSYLVDAGAPVMEILINEGYDLSRIKAVFITHLHGDHLDGLVHMVDLATWYHKMMEFTVYMPEQRGIDAIKAFCMMPLYGETTDRIRYQVIQEGQFFDDGNLKVTSVHNDHMEGSSNVAYGFLLEGEGEKLYITGDMHYTLKDFPEKLLKEPVDLLVSECAHFPADQLLDKLQQTAARQIAIVHVFPSEKYDVFKAYRNTSPVPFFLPNDGDALAVAP